MQHGTGLNDISSFSGHLPGPPVLVQIMEITEIGVSAFQLEQIRAAREERVLAGIGDEEGEEDGDIEVDGEGPMPKYPRRTLHFQVSDGATIFEAMEYRPLPQLGLGSTKLGYKAIFFSHTLNCIVKICIRRCNSRELVSLMAWHSLNLLPLNS